MALVRALTTFHCPGHVTLVEGTILDEKDPVVKGRESLFGPVEASASDAPVQTASRRPGAKSNARRIAG